METEAKSLNSMRRKGMRNLWFSPKHSTSSSSSTTSSMFSSPSRFAFSPSRPSFSDSVMDQTLDMVEPMIIKWDPDTTTTFSNVTSLFNENRKEAKEFIKCVNNLNKAMKFVVTENSCYNKLVRAQSLMQIAMKRLQKDFHQILSKNGAYSNPESVSTMSSCTSTSSNTSYYDDDDNSIVIMADLRLIAECMISSGYAKECLDIYKVIHKSIIDEGICRLGVEKMSSSHVHKMNWEVLEQRIKDWLDAMNFSVKTLFDRERILCDHVFVSNDSIRESCFSDITKDGAMILFGFPENVAKNSKKSPEKLFRYLDMYITITKHWPDIESIFSLNSISAIQTQIVTSLVKLSESVRTSLAEFENAVRKDSSKSLVAGGGIHSLTIDAMDYITQLAEYRNALSDILAEAPTPAKGSLPESYLAMSDSTESPTPTISVRFAWLILVLLCKIDGKAKYYKDVSLAYLFLANNLQYIVTKVRISTNLKFLLGDHWFSKQEAKIKQYFSNYERFGWDHVIASLPQEPATIMTPEEVKEIFKRFNMSFEQAYRQQHVYIVCDSKVRDELKVSIARKMLPAYREFYNRHKLVMVRERHSAHVVRFSPEEIEHRLSDLFFGPVESEDTSLFDSSSSHSTPSQPRDRFRTFS